MLRFLYNKCKGSKYLPSPKIPLREASLSAIGGFIAISALGLLVDVGDIPMLMGSFGASCVLVFGFPDLPFSQPRNVAGGHMLASVCALLCLQLLGPSFWSMSLAVALALFFMPVLGLTHPPAGSNPIIIFHSQPGWSFLLFPNLQGVIIIIMIALVYNNITRANAYPKHW